MREIGLAMMIAALAAACGSDSPCEEYGNRLCEVACGCSETDECVISYGEGSTLSFDSESDCTGFFVNLGCSGDDPDFDYEGCTAGLAEPVCVDTSEGRAVEHPTCDMGNDP